MATTFKLVYPADSVQLTMTGFGGLTSSSTFVAGFELGPISNRTNLDLDHLLGGSIQVGTTPTVNTFIQIWIVPATSFATGTATWPDVFDGTASAETWTSAGIRDGSAILLKTILVDATTSNRNYTFGGLSVAACCGGVLPADYEVFVTHSTVAALNATDGNHNINYIRVQGQSV